MKIVNVDKYHVDGGRFESRQYIVYATDVDRGIIVGKNALLRGLNLHYENNAHVTVHMDEYTKNAVKINALYSANAKKRRRLCARQPGGSIPYVFNNQYI